MTALGLAANQIGLGANIYGTTTPDSNNLLQGIRQPGISLDASGQRVELQPFLSDTWPRKEGGSVPPILSGTIFLANANVPNFIADVRIYTTLRKFSFVDCGQEVYVWVFSGDVQSWPPLAPGGLSLLYRDVKFSFRAYQTPVYRAADDLVLWGA